MAVYTDITNEELSVFLSDYDVGQLLSYRGIAEGVENSNFMVHTSTGNYILTLYEKRVNRDDLPFFLGLKQHLSENGFSCPNPILRADGGMLGELAGRPAAMVSFLEGVWIRRPQPGHCRALGAALAHLHAAGEGFALTRPNSLTLGDWRPLWEQCLASDGEIDADLTDLVGRSLNDLEANWPSDLPNGVIHADAFPDNVFFIGDELSGMIDFYFACNDFLAYDLAVCLNAWCFERDHAFNLTKGTALLTGYQSVRALEEREIAALPTLAAGAALRFMLTRLYDWVNTPPGSLVVKKDPEEYVRKLRFHREVKSATEYGLGS
ncbi:MAG: homoserine kinase [Pseudomonadota bacterium]